MSETATKLPTDDVGLAIRVGRDGVWLNFTASNGQHACIHVGLIQDACKGGMIGAALRSWCADRQKQAEQIRAGAAS